MRKIKRNWEKRYCTNTKNIVPGEIFENQDCSCRNACIINYNEEKRRIFFNVVTLLVTLIKYKLRLKKYIYNR